MKTKNLIIYGAIFLLLTFIYLYPGLEKSFSEKSNHESIEKIATQRGCENIEDCLSKYKFEEARLYLETRENYTPGEAEYKIVKSEISYYLSSGDYQIAFRIFNEYVYEPEIGVCLKKAIMDNWWSESNEGYIKDSRKYNKLIELLIPYFEDDKIKLRILANSLYPECEMGKQTGKKKNGRPYYNFNKNNDRKNELFKIHNLK